MNVALIAVLLSATPTTAPDTVVVCPAAFREALTPWLEHRSTQGHQIVVVSAGRSARAIRADIRTIARQGGLRFVVLIGDVAPNGANAAVRAKTVPTHYARAKINIHWGSEPEIASDDWYADLDDDEVPDVAIGRLTADSSRELADIVTKILAYERQADFGLWRRRVNIVAGLGGFGAVADAALELCTKSLISQGIPTSYATTVTYGSWRSPYCPDPRAFHRHTVDRLNEGCLYWVYIGHGNVRDLDHVRVPGGPHPILHARDVAALRSASGSPIAFFMACYTGAFDATKDCLAEEMLRSPGAPVAVICGSRVTMPYGMAVLGTELLEQCFKHRRETLGEAVLEAKRRMVKPERDDPYREALDLVASAISPVKNELAAERMEHIHLFNLLGDPLLRLRHPREVQLDVPEEAEAGRPLVISGRCDVAGRVIVELVVRRERLTFTPPVRRAYDPSSTALAGYNEVYRRANDPRWESVEEVVTDGKFRTVLDVPRGARGACHVRVFVHGDDAFAVGAADITIRRPPRRSQETTAARSPVAGETTAPQILQR